MAHAAVASVFFFLVACFPSASGKGFLVGDPDMRHTAGPRLNEVHSNMDAVLSCGGSRGQKYFAAMERTLLPMWQTLPKDADGRVDWQTLRYVAHRYFMQRSSLLIRGFEPSRLTSASPTGHVQSFVNEMRHFVEVFQGKNRTDGGFVLKDAMALLAMLEYRLFDSDHTLFDVAHALLPEHFARHAEGSVDRDGLQWLLETYMVHWMLGDNVEAIHTLVKDRHLLNTAFPHWKSVREFVGGRIRTLEFERQRVRVPHHPRSMTPRGGIYSVDDALEVVGGIQRSFADFWQGECTAMKDSLVDMDRSGSGRVPLAKFYKAGLSAEWRFGESEEYLRELGVLDESSQWSGKQVLIPNYMQAASNCIVSTSNYLVCCPNECEAILGEIESEIRAPNALPSVIMQAVQNITSPSSEDGEPPRVRGALLTQLDRLAELHGGEVPLHGRLFAQWLHHIYPRECAFPHKAGALSIRTPSEFGDKHMATPQEMRVHAVVSNRRNASNPEEEKEARARNLLLQWNEDEEELFASYSSQLQSQWEGDATDSNAGKAAIFFLFMVFLAFVKFRKQNLAIADLGCGGFSRSHLV